MKKKYKDSLTIKVKADKVESKDVSVVVQGSVNKELTSKCLKSVRKYLPDAEIILSTWKGTDCSGLDYDILLSNDDPGTNDLIRKYPFKHANNCDRQIVSTRNGIEKASRHYVLKLRTDMILKGSGLLNYYPHYCKAGKNAVFKQRVAFEGNTTLFDLGYFGDWWMFGLKEDLQKYWDIPLYGRTVEDTYFLKPENHQKKAFMNDIVCQFIPEDWITYSFLHKYYAFEYPHSYDRTEAVNIGKNFYLNNVFCIEPELSNIFCVTALNRYSDKMEKINSNVLKKWRRIIQKNTGEKFPLHGIRLFFKRRKKGKVSRNTLFEHTSKIVENFANKTNVIGVSDAVSKIRKEDITFVISGKYSDDFYKNIESVRKHFKTSKVILSTWQGTDVSRVSNLCDYVILSDENAVPDKDFYYHLNDFFRHNNINKQLTLVQKGLERITTEYCVKTRPDLLFKNDDFLKSYEKMSDIFRSYDKNYKIFDSKVLIPNFYTTYRHIPYEYSDIFQFGKTSDIKKIWNSAVLMDEDTATFFSKPENTEKINPASFAHQYTAEQWLYLPLIRQLGCPAPETYWTTDDVFYFEHDKVLSSNFIVTEFGDLGIESKFNNLDSSVLYDNKKFMESYIYNIEPAWKKNKKLLWYRCLFRLKEKKQKIFNKKSTLYKLLHFYWLRGKK